MARKQAVVLIHGIGEQRPMDTLRGFVNAVWTTDTGLHHPFAGGSIWSKPDTVSGGFELRRLVTPRNRAGIETHFYEFYWAHLMKGTVAGHVWAWIKTLVLRNPFSIPRQLRLAYWLLLTAGLAFAGFAAYAFYAKANPDAAMPWWLSALLALVIVPLTQFVIRRIVGDAARYLDAAATNVQQRHEIRQAGLSLLKTLHDPDHGYERIVVVGHSLGTVIGYDILNYAWAEFHREHADTNSGMAALEALERIARDGPAPAEVVRAAQRRYFEELCVNGNPWRVTDFVTMGSPLAHAQVLLARSEPSLRAKQADREFPTCLPVLEEQKRSGERVKRFSFEDPPGRKNGYRVPHHAAVFAPTRWTNLYFPCRWIVVGDLIGGPVRDAMGWGVTDVAVSTARRGGLLAHTSYWAPLAGGATPPCVEALREALGLAYANDSVENDRGEDP